MSESKSIVLNLRLAPAVMGALTTRANQERQPVRRLAALLIEDVLAGEMRSVTASQRAGEPRASLQDFRENPKMKAVEPTLDGNALVAAVLPITGSQFPRQLTWAQKKELSASKGKGKS